jgi:hypothetical protein
VCLLPIGLGSHEWGHSLSHFLSRRFDLSKGYEGGVPIVFPLMTTSIYPHRCRHRRRRNPSGRPRENAYLFILGRNSPSFPSSVPSGSSFVIWAHSIVRFQISRFSSIHHRCRSLPPTDSFPTTLISLVSTSGWFFGFI